MNLRSEVGSDKDGNKVRTTNLFTWDLPQGPNRIETNYPGDADFTAAKDVLHVPTGTLSAKQDGMVTWTFTLQLFGASDTEKVEAAQIRQKPVTFAVDGACSSSDCRRDFNNRFEATFTELENPGTHNGDAIYSGVAARDATFLSVSSSAVFAVPGTPPPTEPPRGGSATTSTTRRVTRPVPTTAALAPINPSPSTTAPQSSTTAETFGTFTTDPTGSGTVAAARTDANPKEQGPPLAVVGATLLALAGLGGVAAFRRYKHGGIDRL
jgi:hypothetical protein